MKSTELRERLARIRQAAEARMDRFVERLRRFVGFETPTERTDRVRDFIRVLRDEIQVMGLQTQELEAPPSAPVLLSWYPPAPEVPAEFDVLFIGHVDTVWPEGEIQRRPFRVEGTRVTGPGVYDMKGGLALLMFTFEVLRDLGEVPAHRHIGWLWTTDEEAGSPGARPRIQEWARRARYVLSLEPAAPGGAVKVERYGVAVLEVTFRGRSGHPGLRSGGVNAIEQALGWHGMLRAWTVAHEGLWVTLAKIRGGQRTNQIPDTCRMIYDVRYADPSHLEALRTWLTAFQALPLDPERPETRRLTWTLETHMPPLPAQASRAAFERARSIAALLDWNLEGVRVGGGGDSAYAAEVGARVLDGLGVDGDGAHTPNEWADLSTVPRRVAFLAGLWWDL